MVAPRIAGERPDHKRHMQGDRAQTKERGQAIDQKPAGIDDPRMQQCRRGCWRIEIAGEPDEQGKLRRLTHGSDKQEQCDHRRPADLDARPRCEQNRRFGGLGKKRLEFQCAVELIGENNAGQKGHIADPQEGKSPDGPFARRLMGVIVGEQIEQTADDLPEKEQHHEVDAGDHAEQHRDRKADER